jgi:hypothetical protein
MPRLVAFAAAVLLIAASPAAAAEGAESDAAHFMSRFSGEWHGTGRVLVGPDHGAKFHCSLAGDPRRSAISFGLTGRCWIGHLSAPVHARLRYNAETDRFYGAFLDGAEGSGVDIVGARSGEGFVMNLSRGMAQGRLTAEPVGRSQMKVMISLVDRANDREIPVVAMGFAKEEVIGLPLHQPDSTGSLAQAE